MGFSKKTKRRQIYQTPQIRTEKMFETASLACGKCTTGPFPQYQCGAYTRLS